MFFLCFSYLLLLRPRNPRLTRNSRSISSLLSFKNHSSLVFPPHSLACPRKRPKITWSASIEHGAARKSTTG